MLYYNSLTIHNMLYYRFLCSITWLCCKCKCFGVPLHVLKLKSLILVKLNCPVRDDYSFLTWPDLIWLTLWGLTVSWVAQLSPEATNRQENASFFTQNNPLLRNCSTPVHKTEQERVCLKPSVETCSDVRVWRPLLEHVNFDSCQEWVGDIEQSQW